MTHDVFISYSHHDKSAADAVCAKLEQHGIRCWIAPRDVEPGTEWAGSIIHGISKSRIMVLVFSKNANESPQIRKEVERAVNKGVIVVPLRIEDVIPTESLEYFMSNVHWLDALTPPLDKHLDHLAGTVKIMLERMVIRDEPMPRAAPVEHPITQPTSLEAPQDQFITAHRLQAPAAPTRHFLRLRVFIACSAILVVLSLAVYFIWKSRLPAQFAEDHTLIGHSAMVSSVAFSPDGRWLASSSTDKTVRMWDLSTSLQIWATRFPENVSAVAFSPDGRSLVFGCSDGTLQSHDSATGHLVWTVPNPSAVTRVAFSPDGHTLASGDVDKTVRIWDASNGRIVHTLSGHTDVVLSVAFSSDGRWLASGGSDNTVKLWDPTTGVETRTITEHTAAAWAVAFSPDSQRLASAGADGTIRVWDPVTGGELRTVKSPGSIICIAFSPNGRMLASGDWNYNVILWDAASLRKLSTLKGHTNIVTSAAFSPDGRWLATGGGDKLIILWRRTN